MTECPRAAPDEDAARRQDLERMVMKLSVLPSRTGKQSRFVGDLEDHPACNPAPRTDDVETAACRMS